MPPLQKKWILAPSLTWRWKSNFYTNVYCASLTDWDGSERGVTAHVWSVRPKIPLYWILKAKLNPMLCQQKWFIRGKKPIFVLFCSQVHLKLKEYAYTTIAVSCKSCQPFKVKPSFSGKPSVPRIAYPVWLNIKPHCCSLIHQVLMCLLIPLPFFLRIQRWEESLSELIPQQDMFEKCQYDFGKERKKSPFVVVYVATTMAAVNLMPECNYNAMLVW